MQKRLAESRRSEIHTNSWLPQVLVPDIWLKDVGRGGRGTTMSNRGRRQHLSQGKPQGYAAVIRIHVGVIERVIEVVKDGQELSRRRARVRILNILNELQRRSGCMPQKALIVEESRNAPCVRS